MQIERMEPALLAEQDMDGGGYSGDFTIFRVRCSRICWVALILEFFEVCRGIEVR